MPAVKGNYARTARHAPYRAMAARPQVHNCARQRHFQKSENSITKARGLSAWKWIAWLQWPFASAQKARVRPQSGHGLPVNQ